MAFTVHPQDCKCFHIVIHLRENQRLVAHHRTQPLQYTSTQISPHPHPHNPDGPLLAQAPFGVLTCSKWHLTCCPSISLSKDPQTPTTAARPTLCSRVTKAKLSRFPLAAAAAAAKSLQSCPTLCDPIDSSPPCSPVPGILQARTLEWVATSFSNA